MPARPEQDLAEAEAVLAEWRERQQAADQELGAIDQETLRLRAELHALAERRRVAERQATVARREQANVARRVESAKRRAGEDP